MCFSPLAEELSTACDLTLSWPTLSKSVMQLYMVNLNFFLYMRLSPLAAELSPACDLISMRLSLLAAEPSPACDLISK